MSPSTTPAAANLTSKPSTKSPKSKIVKLLLSPTLLAKFPSDSIALSTPLASSSSDTVNVPVPNAPEPAAVSTPLPASSNLLAPPTAGSKRKGGAGKPALKRTASQLDAGAPKPRGKPGPKKKARIRDVGFRLDVSYAQTSLVVQHTSDPNSLYSMLTYRRGENGEVLTGNVTPAAPKLGPKANQGAINACLRALDRTGKPTRKWQKTGFKVRSFTGYAWATGTYATHRKTTSDFAGDVKSDSSSSGDLKATQDSSIVASNSGPDIQTPNPPAHTTSSPLATAVVNPVA
ncbi:hypothetical protein FKW77_008373 [Venturia effusa]|uniref:Uncharacterized protein n=1 Tax=Venturia effusa TaxID=50376 RepID=A0A517L5X4_9PEZI|nr:hypothetical protein FKW77_008373 [Venturia effusa]